MPSAPTELTAERIGPREAIVNWRPPKDLGGDIIQGYLVELRESTDPLSSPVSPWTPASTSLIKSGTTFRAVDLNPTMSAQFRVRARNPVGYGEPSDLSDWVKPVKKGEMFDKAHELDTQSLTDHEYITRCVVVEPINVACGGRG